MEDAKIALIGFKNLDESEIDTAKEIILKSLNKLDRTDSVDFIKIELKTHKHSKEFVHEVTATTYSKSKRMNAEESDKNLFKAVRNVMDKLIVESEHINKSNKTKTISNIDKIRK
jgi:ribosome-associated translation inhibitor RaiA